MAVGVGWALRLGQCSCVSALTMRHGAVHVVGSRVACDSVGSGDTASSVTVLGSESGLGASASESPATDRSLTCSQAAVGTRTSTGACAGACAGAGAGTGVGGGGGCGGRGVCTGPGEGCGTCAASVASAVGGSSTSDAAGCGSTIGSGPVPGVPVKEVQASDGEPVLVMSASTRRLVVGVSASGCTGTDKGC